MIKSLISIIIVTVVIWMFIPLIILIIGSGVINIFKYKSLYIIKGIKSFMGLGILSDDGVIRQSKTNDCGTAALKNGLKKLDISYNNIDLPEPAFGEEIKQAVIGLGLEATGYDNANYEFIKENLKNNTAVLTLLKVIYLFEAWWVRPTKWFFKYLVGDLQAYHWVALERVENNKVIIIDPYFGRIVLKKKSFEDSWNRIVLVITKEVEKNLCTGSQESDQNLP